MHKCGNQTIRTCSVVCGDKLREGGGVFGFSSGAWRPRQSAVEEEEEELLDGAPAGWLTPLSKRTHSLFSRAHVYACIKARVRIRQARGHVGEEGARADCCCCWEGGEGGVGEVGGASNQSASGPLILHWRAGGTTAPGHSGAATRSTVSQRGDETG